jgi:uncharacterized protein (TIGR00369 family)
MTAAALPDVAQINAFMRRSAFNRWLGIEAIHADPSEARLRIPWRPELGGAPQMTHGGIFAVIIDVAAFAAIYAASGNLGPTVDMRVDFHANASPGELLAVARTLKSGRHILSGEVFIYDEGKRLLASGRCVYFNKADHLDL